MYNSTAYAKHYNMPSPKGIVIHSSLMPRPYLRWYVKPGSKNQNKQEILDKIGYNNKMNDYNHTHRDHNFHYWIGKDQYNQVMVIKTMPTNMQSWNTDRYIHICICEDKKDDVNYLRDCMTQTLLLCEQLCKEYNWDENQVHYYSELKDLDDFKYWFEKFGYSQEYFRKMLKQKFDKKKNL